MRDACLPRREEKNGQMLDRVSKVELTRFANGCESLGPEHLEK